MNSVTLTGRLAQEPKRRTAGEIEICDMRLAVQRRRGRDGEDRGAKPACEPEPDQKPKRRSRAKQQSS